MDRNPVDTLKTRLKKVGIAATANARLKSWMVERDAAAVRQRYSRISRRDGLVVPTGPALQLALQRRLAHRPAQLRWPKKPGDLHVFLAYGLHNWEEVLPQAMRQFGQVSQYEWRSRGFDDRASDWVSHRDAMNAELLAAFDKANRERPVDVVVGYVSGYTVSPAVLQEMALRGAVITNFCFDDKICWPGPILGGRPASPAAIASAVDLNLSCDPDGALRYFAHGGLCMFHPEAADPEWYKPTDGAFEYDVSFVGARYGWRPKLIEGLNRAGIEVACFGHGWPNGPISNEEMNGLYGRSRINLGCGGIGYSKDLLCLKGRDFEVPMSGAVYLTQANPELSMVYDVGKEILTYRDVGECGEIIRRVLGDPDEAARLRRAARARCLRDHTYLARWTNVFRMLGAAEAVST